MDNNIQLFRQFLSNQFKEGGKKNKGHSRPSYNEQTFLQDYNTAWKGTRYDTPEWRAFWTKLAKRESSFNPQVMNSIGAKGYFQLMPFNRSSTWTNNTQQFAEADKLIRSMEARITSDDLRRAEALGLNKQALLAGAWLGGIGGMRDALRGKTRADNNGTTVMSRMKDFNNLIPSQPEIDPIEQYLNTQVGSHIIDNPMYEVGAQYQKQPTVLVDSNTPVQELDSYTNVLPEVVVTATSPQRKAMTQQLLTFGMQNQPEIASILVPNTDIPSVTNKIAALSQIDTNRMAQQIEDNILRQNIESNLANSQFTHFFDKDQTAQQRDQVQDLRFLRDMNNTAAYGGNIFVNGSSYNVPFISDKSTLFYDGGNTEDEIKATIAQQWPATQNVNYTLKPQEGFSQFVDENGNPRGTIETITPNQVATRWSPIYAEMGIPINERPLLEEANRVDYRNYDEAGNPIGEILMGKNYITTNQPGQNTIVYNPQYTKVEDIKQDLLHVMHDDPEYEKLYDIYMTAALNDMDFLYHDFSEGDQRLVEAMMNGEFSNPTNGNLERGLNADATLQAQLDGYLREQFYPGTPEERIAAGYTGVPYTIKNPSLLKAINNIKRYLEQKALGGTLIYSTKQKETPNYIYPTIVNNKYAQGGGI